MAVLGQACHRWGFQSSPHDPWLITKDENVVVGLHWQALEALDALAAYHEGHGAYGEAIACARRQVALEPWQEVAHRRWMRALALSGQRGKVALLSRAPR